MTALQFIFYIFSVVAVVSAVMVVSVKNPVHSVLSLVVTFFAMAVIWMTLRAEFLSLILLLVYVGAVMTLFLFVVMMLNIVQETETSRWVGYRVFGILLVLLLVAFLIAAEYGRAGVLTSAMTATPSDLPDFSNIHQLGLLLFSNYAYPFEIAGVILLAAMIAAITLTHRAPIKRKSQEIAKQVAVRAEDRVRLISMPSESKEEGASS